MRESWTDERLDDGFNRVTTDIATLRGEIGELRKEMHQEIGGLRQDFAALQRTLIQVGGGMIVGMLGIIFTQL